MAQAERKFMDGVNYYVPGMQAGGDLGQALNGRVSFGKPVVALATGILNAQSIAAAVDTTTFATSYAATDAIMGKFGRNLTVVASGAAATNVTVYGRDYLGQKMTESFTLNGTTPVIGMKAFKYVDRVTAALVGGTTINLGYGAKFGLPYVTTSIKREYADNVVAAAGTLQAPVFTDPQTATTSDPRGMVTPTTTPNGAKLIEMDLEFTNFVNASNNGGMHGIRHFFA